jgi:hypothetical protein
MPTDIKKPGNKDLLKVDPERLNKSNPVTTVDLQNGR